MKIKEAKELQKKIDEFEDTYHLVWSGNGCEVERLDKDSMIAFEFYNYPHKITYINNRIYLRRIFSNLIEL